MKEGGSIVDMHANQWSIMPGFSIGQIEPTAHLHKPRTQGYLGDVITREDRCHSHGVRHTTSQIRSRETHAKFSVSA